MGERWNWYGAGLALCVGAVQLMPMSDIWKWIISVALIAAALACFAKPHMSAWRTQFFGARGLPMVPLKEAAIRAYETDRHGGAAGMAEAMAEGDTDKVITWFCWSLWNHLPIFGAHSPSRAIEKIDRSTRNRYTFKIVQGELILDGLYGKSRYVDLQVAKRDLPAALDKIKALNAAEVDHGLQGT
jgi:hypothetical protein